MSDEFVSMNLPVNQDCVRISEQHQPQKVAKAYGAGISVPEVDSMRSCPAGNTPSVAIRTSNLSVNGSFRLLAQDVCWTAIQIGICDDFPLSDKIFKGLRLPLLFSQMAPEFLT